MDEKDPSTYSWLTYGWVIGLSSLAGIVSFYGKLNNGTVKVFNVTQFIGEIATSGLVGLITFFLCEFAHFNPLLTAALIGISGHMGSRAILVLENILEKRVEKYNDKV